jgi:sec-independent protein translocase protein TatA
MFGIGWQELLLILFILMLLFGAKKLPELAKSIGTAFGEFRRGIAGDEKKEKDEPDKTQQK